MELFFIHLLKSCLVLTLFLVAYLVFLKRETLFNGNRFFLGSGVLISILLPFFEITQITYVERPELSYLETSEIVPEAAAETFLGLLEPWTFLTVLYLAGVLVLGIRLCHQFIRIWHIRRQSDVQREDSFYHVLTHRHISPFSFFKHIFYHPRQFAKAELDLIVSHEKVHARELHSLDILITEFLIILQWFNPFAWYYGKMIKQNLEFVADHKTCTQEIDKKRYQYLMLQQVLTHQNLSIINPFFNSLTQLSLFGRTFSLRLPSGQIKKRILMLHQKPSHKRNYGKALIILPFLGLFLLAFNTKKEVRYAEDTNIVVPAEAPNFKTPIKQEAIRKVSSKFGEVQNGIAKGKLHKGIDLVAKKGTEVNASASGTVAAASYNNTNGNFVIIDHGQGYATKYLHLDKKTVALNETIEVGKVLGYVGNTGVSSGPHLHFEIVKDKQALNPESFVAFIDTDIHAEPKKKIEKIKTVPIQLKAAPKSIELLITKETTDAQLEKMKADLAKDAIDFSYTVVHNEAMEIEEIKFELRGKSTNGGTFNNAYSSSIENGAIKPIVIYIDLEENLVSVGSKNSTTKVHTNKTAIWVTDSDSDPEEIIIKEENGDRKIFIDGEEVDEDDLEENSFTFYSNDEDDDHKIKIISSGKNSKKIKKKNKSSEVHIINKDNDNTSIEIINSDKSDISVRTGGNKKPLYLIDGEEVSAKVFAKFETDKIKSVNVYKGKSAKKKYGKKAKNGVVEITTKEN